ncbi:hypothetical protein [Pseudomonas sp. ESBL1]|uniref:hypothetical protein n=1 Tax=Pseudomonas sp. ESBL1 TaxID=3077324 RepID=UPI002FC83F21
MTRLALCLLLLATLAGCKPDCWSSDPEACQAERQHARNQPARASAAALPAGVWTFEDRPRGVVCYVMDSLGNSSISCVKVWLPQVAGNERQLSPHETQPEPTPAMAPGRWIDERYQL